MITKEKLKEYIDEDNERERLRKLAKENGYKIPDETNNGVENMDELKNFELKPCPFCGSGQLIVKYSISDLNKDTLIIYSNGKKAISCNYCDGTGPFKKQLKNSVSLWNKRHDISSYNFDEIAKEAVDMKEEITRGTNPKEKEEIDQRMHVWGEIELSTKKAPGKRSLHWMM